MNDNSLHPPRAAEPSARAGFVVNRLDRLTERRGDEAFIQALSQADASRSLVFSGDVPILKRVGEDYEALFTAAEAASLGVPSETVFLGVDGKTPYFARLIEADAKQDAETRGDIVGMDLRAIAAQHIAPIEILGVLGQAKSLLYWHSRHRFCSNCGAPSRVSAAGWRRSCDVCGAQHFPRTDPVVIMLVFDGEECLLGRASQEKGGYPPGLYSCLAGFMESGETCEDAVRREVLEETGVRTGCVDYFASQPWPFPASLMIGCFARALTRTLTIDKKELEDAQWFSREEVRLMLEGAHPRGLTCPPKLAIAHHLIRSWAVGDAP